MLKILFAGALILSSATLPAVAQVGPGVGSGYIAYVCTNDVGGRLTMRRAPGQKSRQIMQIPAGANLRVIRSVDGSDGFQWFQVAYRGKMGFVRSDFVCNHES